MNISFEEWKSQQDFNITKHLGWRHKWLNKVGGYQRQLDLNLLTLDQYLHKAWEADLADPSQVSIDQYHLSRIGDLGTYTVDNCRFLIAQDNLKERDSHTDDFSYTQGENSQFAILTNEQVIYIFTSPKSLDELCSEFPQVHRQTLIGVIRRYKWKSVTQDLVPGNSSNYVKRVSNEVIKYIYTCSKSVDELLIEFPEFTRKYLNRVINGHLWSSLTKDLPKGVK